MLSARTTLCHPDMVSTQIRNMQIEIPAFTFRNTVFQDPHTALQDVHQTICNHGLLIMANSRGHETPTEDKFTARNIHRTPRLQVVTKLRMYGTNAAKATPLRPLYHLSQQLHPRAPHHSYSINADEKNGKHKAESRILVRSHVMSTFYRKRNSSQSHEETSPRDIVIGGLTSKFRMETYPHRRKPRLRKDKPGTGSRTFKNESLNITISIPKDLYGSKPLDPFAAAALPWDSNMQNLVHHCSFKFPPSNITEPCVSLLIARRIDAANIPESMHPLKYRSYHVQNFILDMAITDKALLHAIVAYAMIHKFCFGANITRSEVEKARYISSNLGVLDHQTQAIPLVNKKLSVGEVDDVTIATTLILL